MDTDRARLIAERLHAGDREDDGTPLLHHVRRVAHEAPAEARVVAWLHEALEWTAIAEQELLANGLTSDELRALRLLHRTHDSRSDRVYLAHVYLTARAAGSSGGLARVVKIADLEDRRLHPRVRADGWSPPYARGLELLRDPSDGWHRAPHHRGDLSSTEMPRLSDRSGATRVDRLGQRAERTIRGPAGAPGARGASPACVDD